jgi:hypothetical protein
MQSAAVPLVRNRALARRLPMHEEREVRAIVRVARHVCGTVRVVFERRTDTLRRDDPWRAELWTWMRVDRRWELALVARESTKLRAARALLDAVLAM